MDSLFTVLFGFLQTILLARLLPVATFGVVAAAMAVIVLSRIISNFGLGAAFLHRAPETQDIDRAAANHFTLNLLFTVGWAVLMFAGVFLLVDPAQTELRLAFIVLILCDFVVQIANTPRAILNRQVQHRRLALLSITDAIVTAGVSITLALNGFTLWALLAASMSNAFLNILFLFTWRPVWKPRFAWEPKTIRYFLSFGSRSFVARFLLEALDRVDDLWTAVFLGTEPLGYYSRAYRFATYPRAFIAGPIYQVAGGVYAELKGDRVRLSKAFMQVNSLMIRSGFLLAGLLALAAPEIIRIVLGDKWMPMLDAFRLMLVYTLFDPIKQTVANLFNAMGLPETVVQIRAVQFLVMVSGLFLLGFRLGIAGIALAVDIMLVFGIILFFQKAKTHVDYSLKELLVTPTMALFFGLVTGFVAAQWHGIAGNDWLTGAAKAILFTIVYGSILMLWDRRQVNEIWALVGRHLIKR